MSCVFLHASMYSCTYSVFLNALAHFSMYLYFVSFIRNFVYFDMFSVCFHVLLYTPACFVNFYVLFANKIRHEFHTPLYVFHFDMLDRRSNWALSYTLLKKGFRLGTHTRESSTSSTCDWGIRTQCDNRPGWSRMLDLMSQGGRSPGGMGKWRHRLDGPFTAAALAGCDLFPLVKARLLNVFRRITR